MAILTCGYGVTGAGKTVAQGEAIKYIYKKTGKPVRGIYSDLGNWESIKPLVRAGILIPFNISGEPNLLSLLHKLARGYWPIGLGEDGIVTERHPLIVSDKNPSPIPLGDPKMRHGVEGIGAYLFEGLTSTSELMMKYLRDYKITMKQELVTTFSVKDQDTGKNVTFGANPLGHYNYVQDEVGLALLAEFSALPVERVFITAHEAIGQEEDTKDPIRGPGLVGKAYTAKLGKNLGDLLHFELITKPVQGGLAIPEYRVYFLSHPDPKFANITYPCKTRLGVDQVAEMLKTFPGGFFKPTQFGEFLDRYDELMAKSADSAIAWREQVDAGRGKG